MSVFYRVFLSLLIFNYLTLFSQTYSGTIIRIIDGDTFVFQGEEGSLKIRMNGIDAPESDQPFGKESKEFLNSYSGESCTIETSRTDKYGRSIATLIIDNKKINLLMARKGFARHYKKYSSAEQLSEAEILAKKEKLGLWRNENPIAPWKWRLSLGSGKGKKPLISSIIRLLNY